MVVNDSLSAAHVASLAASQVAAMESSRSLSADVVKAMAEAGFMRHLVPASFGGSAGTFASLLQAVSVVGEQCAASAWCASLFASTPRFLTFFPTAGQEEVWADGPDAAVVCSVIPFGSGLVDGDGLRVSGRWPYLSGIEFADWVIVCPKVGDSNRLVVVPRSECSVEDTWFSVGMQATGSNTVVLEDVFVPAHRICDWAALFAGRGGLVPLPAVNGLTFVGPALGAARGMLALLTTYLGTKIANAPVLPGMPGVAGNLATYEAVLARSSAEIDAAGLLLERVADAADSGVARGVVARSARDSAYAIEVLVGAVNRMFRTAGTNGQAAGGALQRLWRDVNSIATHQALQFEPNARNYTKALFATSKEQS